DCWSSPAHPTTELISFNAMMALPNRQRISSRRRYPLWPSLAATPSTCSCAARQARLPASTLSSLTARTALRSSAALSNRQSANDAPNQRQHNPSLPLKSDNNSTPPSRLSFRSPSHSQPLDLKVQS